MKMNRREAVMSALFGAGLVGLRALASGVPASILLNPRAATADTVPVPKNPQFLIFSTSFGGDPVSCNVPGTYEDARITHGAYPEMAATPINFGTSSVKGAQVWSGLPASVLANTCFFHHSTYTLIHSDEGKVLRLNGGSSEMLPSLIATRLASSLKTIRSQPITLGGLAVEDVYVNGAPQPLLKPTTIASVLSAPKDGLGAMNLLSLRDKTLDQLNAYAKTRGKAAQAEFVDKYATSTTQLRTLQDKLLGSLATIKDNSQDSQIQAAITLFQMKVAPVATVHIDFGGDNHFDAALAHERDSHVSGVQTLVNMTKALAAAGMTDQVTFCMNNVFGRSMDVAGTVSGASGRDHNMNHNVALMIGPAIKGGVVGGIAYADNIKTFQAQPIASATGKAAASGDIIYAQTLASVGKTLASACGVLAADIDTDIFLGKVVSGALNRLT